MRLAHSAIIGLTALLTACGQQAETNDAATTNAASVEAGNMQEMAGNMSGDMGNMAMPVEGGVQMAKGTGTVTAIDKAAGTITLDHSPIAQIDWPAMKMAFKARPELLDTVKVGDKVAFDLTLKDGTSELTAIEKQ